MPTPSPYAIQNVSVSTDWVEITFLEERKQTEGVKEATTLAIFKRDFPSQTAELEEVLVEFLEAARLGQRNPPKTVRR